MLDNNSDHVNLDADIYKDISQCTPPGATKPRPTDSLNNYYSQQTCHPSPNTVFSQNILIVEMMMILLVMGKNRKINQELISNEHVMDSYLIHSVNQDTQKYILYLEWTSYLWNE